MEDFLKITFSPAVMQEEGERVQVIFFLITVRPLSREITMSQAYQNMCAGMFKVSCWK